MGTLVSDLTIDSDAHLLAKARALNKTRNLKGVFLKEPFVTPRRAKHIFIVCGNCAGDDPIPRKTVMAADSTCETCGGSSYVLASTLFLSIQKRQEEEVRQSQLSQIYELAEAVGLILPADEGKPRDATQYTAFLVEHYGTGSADGMQASERTSLITALTLMKREYDEP